MLAVYVTLIVSEGNNQLWASVPWAVAMATAAALALLGAFRADDDTARKLLLGSAFLSFALGVVSILSIGIGFLVAGGLALLAANRVPRAS
jgi:hypothetical protein